MKKVLILVVLLTFISCNKSYRTLEEGIWFDQATERDKIEIIKEHDSLFLFYRGKQFYIHERKRNDFVLIANRKIPIWKEEENIKFTKRTFIPESETLPNKFIGTWRNKDLDIVIDIEPDNGSLIWTIKEGDNKANNYYPKRTEQGFAITYKGEILNFSKNYNYLEDSKKRKFYKSF